MKKCTVELRNAVSNNLVNLSGYLLKHGLISEHNEHEIRNEYTPEANRAAKLIDMIQNKVKESHENYDKFIEILKEADSEYYKGTLKILDETLHETIRKGNSFNPLTLLDSDSNNNLTMTLLP